MVLTFHDRDKTFPAAQRLKLCRQALRPIAKNYALRKRRGVALVRNTVYLSIIQFFHLGFRRNNAMSKISVVRKQ